MSTYSNLISLLDNGVDGAFAATLAGLALAAAAFYAPTADNILQNARTKLKEKELENVGDVRGYDPSDTPLKREIEELKATIYTTLKAQRSLLKAFVILVVLVAHSISFDSVIDAKFLEPLAGEGLASLFQTGDVVVSAILLMIAGTNLLTGASAIGGYFKITFDEELSRINELKEAVVALRKWRR